MPIFRFIWGLWQINSDGAFHINQETLKPAIFSVRFVELSFGFLLIQYDGHVAYYENDEKGFETIDGFGENVTGIACVVTFLNKVKGILCFRPGNGMTYDF